MKILCYGDSNTYGYDPCAYFGGRYDQNTRWVDILARSTGWSVINQGGNGRTIPQNLSNFSWLYGSEPDCLIVMLGTNDLLQGYPASSVADRMKNFLEGLTLERQKILLIAPPQMKSGTWVTDTRLIRESIALGNAYQSLSEHLGVRYLNASQWEIELTFDGVHFTEYGHQCFANYLLTHFLK